MINVTAQELEAILSTIEKALDMHEQWRDQLQRTLACKLPPREADMADDAHHHCAFGQWFYSPANAHLRKLPSFQKIEQLHELMHGHARELCIRLKGHWQITPQEYDPYIAHLHQFRGELLSLRHKVFETLHKIDPLTGAFCSMHLLSDLKRDQEKCKTSGTAYSLLLLNFDLVGVNRGLGREKGDEILRDSIAAIRQSLKQGDKIFRYTGAEFVICLPGRSHAEAHKLKEQILVIVSQTVAQCVGNNPTCLDIHYGVIELEPDSYVEQLISQAKRAIYTVKI